MDLDNFTARAYAESEFLGKEKEIEAFVKGAEWYRKQREKRYELDVTYAYYGANIVITDPCYMEHSRPEMERGTIYGDWSCMVYPGKMEENKKYEEWDAKYKMFWHNLYMEEHTEAEKEQLRKEFRRFRLIWEDENIIGKFCADSGRVAVYVWDRMDEQDRAWAKEHKSCAAIIPNFTGNINFVVKDNQLYVVGEGEKPFFTVQSGF